MRARPAESSPWLHRFGWFTACATLFLICSGGMVTSKGAGLAVPDWPTTFGYNMFLFPVSKWIGGILFEHVHRLIASCVGMFTILLATWLYFSESRRWVRNLGYAAVGAVILQGILGGLRVTLLKDEIGIFHACLAQGFFGLLVVIATVLSPFWLRLSAERSMTRNFRSLTSVAFATTALIYLQLALGATMRHEHRDLSILDFPLAYGKILPDTSAAALTTINHWRDARALSDVNAFQIWLQMIHRFVAAAIAVAVLSFWFLVRARLQRAAVMRGLSTIWIFLIAGQITLGAWTIWSNKAADIATAHVAVGATTLALGAAICAIIIRLRLSQNSSRTGQMPFVRENAIIL